MNYIKAFSKANNDIPIVFVHGSSCTKPSMRGHQALPRSDLIKFICNHFVVLKIDEFHTTKKCNQCKDVNLQYGERSETGRQVGQCISITCQLNYIERDRNACKNIFDNFIYMVNNNSRKTELELLEDRRRAQQLVLNKINKIMIIFFFFFFFFFFDIVVVMSSQSQPDVVSSSQYPESNNKKTKRKKKKKNAVLLH